MGFYFRKSVRAGPFRINVGRSGIGYSVGGRGFRTGRTARGRRYSTISVPGTGVGYRVNHKRGCMVMLVGMLSVIAGVTALRVLQEVL